MKIFSCIESFLPGVRGGGPVRALANMVDWMGDENDFRIFTRSRDYLSSEVYPNVTTSSWTQVGNGKIYYSLDEGLVRHLWNEVLDFKPDWVYLNGAFAPLTRLFLTLRWRNKELRKFPVIIAPHGNVSSAALQHHSIRKHAWLKASRAMGLYRNVIWHAASVREAEQVKETIGPKVVIRNVPMAPAKLEGPDFAKLGRASLESGAPFLRLIYFGRVSQEKNLGFALDILSRMEATISFDIIGSCDDLRLMEELEMKAGRLSENIKVRFFDLLPHAEMMSQLSQYDALLMPSLTENFSYTVLESLQAGLPVVISDQTPWRGLIEKGIGWDLCLGSTTEWEEVFSLLLAMDEKERADLSQRCQLFSEAWVGSYCEKAKALFA